MPEIETPYIEGISNIIRYRNDTMDLCNNIYDFFVKDNHDVDKQVIDYIKAKLNDQNTGIKLQNIQHNCSICKTPRNAQNEWKLLANPSTNKSKLLEIIFPILICEKCYRIHILQETKTIFEVGIAVLPITLDNIKHSQNTSTSMTSASSLYDSVSGMETMKVQTLHKSKSLSKSLVFTSQSPSKVNKLKSNTSTPNSNTPTNNRSMKSSSPKPAQLQQPPPSLQEVNIKQDNENNEINRNESLQINNPIPKNEVNTNLSSTIATISSLQLPPNAAQMPKCYSVQLQKVNTYNENRKGIKRGEYDEEKCSMLQKRSNGFFKKWKYVCVVLSGEYLLVFNKADDKVPKHVYNIKGCIVDHDDKLSVKNLPNVFEVNCKEKDKKVVVYFATNNSVEDEYDWINAIRNNSKQSLL